MRSVMLSALWYCDERERDGLARLRRRQKIEADVFERAPSGAVGIRPIGSRRDHPPVGVGERRAEPLADRGAQVPAGGKDRIGIDVAADLAGDVGLARRRQRQRDEGGLEFGVGEDRAERAP